MGMSANSLRVWHERSTGAMEAAPPGARHVLWEIMPTEALV